jgi:hypothetical protein
VYSSAFYNKLKITPRWIGRLATFRPVTPSSSLPLPVAMRLKHPGDKLVVWYDMCPTCYIQHVDVAERGGVQRCRDQGHGKLVGARRFRPSTETAALKVFEERYLSNPSMDPLPCMKATVFNSPASK